MARNILEYQSIPKLILKFALPSVMVMLINALYNIVDQIFIGNYLGYLANTATTITFPIITIILAITTLIAVGASANIAVFLGEKKLVEAEKMFNVMIFIILISSLILTTVCLINLDQILIFAGARASTIDYARDYATIIVIGAVFSILGVGLSRAAACDGKPALALYSVLVGAILNVILDPIYIDTLGLGVKGSAIATVSSQILTVIILLWYFTRKSSFRIKLKYFQFDFNYIMEIIKIGFPNFILQIMNTILMIVLNNSLTYYGDLVAIGMGDIALSAVGIVLKINGILISICIGISIGMQPILGFNLGAKKYQRVKNSYLISVLISTIICSILFIFLVPFSKTALALFGTQSVEFNNFANFSMRTIMMVSFLYGFQIISNGYFQATKQTLKATFLSVARSSLFLIPLIYFLPKIMGLNGIIYAFPLSDIIFTLLLIAIVFIEIKKLNLLIKQEA